MPRSTITAFLASCLLLACQAPTDGAAANVAGQATNSAGTGVSGAAQAPAPAAANDPPVSDHDKLVYTTANGNRFAIDACRKFEPALGRQLAEANARWLARHKESFERAHRDALRIARGDEAGLEQAMRTLSAKLVASVERAPASECAILLENFSRNERRVAQAASTDTQVRLEGATVADAKLVADVVAQARIALADAGCERVERIEVTAGKRTGPFNTNGQGRLVSGEIVEHWRLLGCDRSVDTTVTFRPDSNGEVNFQVSFTKS